MPQHRVSLLTPALIFFGSGSGGLLRYWLGGVIQDWWGPTFPLGTLAVNASGCFVMGFLATAPVLLNEEYRSAVLIGFLGGYTTFSSFSRETLAFVHNGEWWRAAGYIATSVALSLLAVWVGAALASKLYGPGAD